MSLATGDGEGGGAGLAACEGPDAVAPVGLQASVPGGVEQAAAAGAAEGAGAGGGAAADAEAGGKDGVAMRSVDDGVALAVCKGPEALAAAEPQASAPGGVEQAPVLGEAEGAGARGTPLRFEWKRPATASVPIGLPGSSEQVATSATCYTRRAGPPMPSTRAVRRGWRQRHRRPVCRAAYP
jgi:hypothetical protein